MPNDFILLVILALALVSGVRADEVTQETDTRIVGGSEAVDGEFPHQVSLRQKYSKGWHHFCGGSILSARWILSAAHCTERFTKDQIRVVVGTNSLNSGGDLYEVEKIIRHEKYNNTSFANDVEVIKVKKDIKFGAKVKAISLPTSNTGGDVQLVTSGWGYIDIYHSQPNKLQKLTVKSLSVKKCQESELRIYRYINPITENQICTFKKARMGICQGDSGGPLTENKILVGITSWNIPCAQGRPDVFTRVFSYVDWIKKHAKD
ncbi:unnamed protein product [Leptosia nina]|uniref:trypsin n=1 Tax=Leptosia nina TaxID=320188 RepID=A0AAV1JQY4_9NEOP